MKRMNDLTPKQQGIRDAVSAVLTAYKATARHYLPPDRQLIEVARDWYARDAARRLHCEVVVRLYNYTHRFFPDGRVVVETDNAEPYDKAVQYTCELIFHD